MVQFSNAAEGRQRGGSDSGSDRGLESSCDDMSSSEPEVEPEAEPKPVDFKPEVLDTEDVKDGWRAYYVKVLRRVGKGYTPIYPGLEGVGILNGEDSSDDSSDEIDEIDLVNESSRMPVWEAMD